jgi:hypothetical protein
VKKRYKIWLPLLTFGYKIKIAMAKSTKGGKKISFKDASSAQKLYWDVLVGKKKIKPEQLPQSFSYNLYKLKAYLNELEAAFGSDVSYDDRYVSILPIAYTEKGKITIMLTPSVLSADGVCINQFCGEEKSKKTNLKAAAPPPLPSIGALNDTCDHP